jgi:hypothetical protein
MVLRSSLLPTYDDQSWADTMGLSTTDVASETSATTIVSISFLQGSSISDQDIKSTSSIAMLSTSHQAIKSTSSIATPSTSHLAIKSTSSIVILSTSGSSFSPFDVKI